MRAYLGERRPNGCFVEVLVEKENGSVIHRNPLDPHLDLMRRNPKGWFEWGWGCDQSEQLAVAILADCIGGAEAKEHYLAFTMDMICKLPHDSWRMEASEIGAWHVKQHGKEEG